MSGKAPMANKTPLYDRHCALGAKIVDFFGWEMPIYYESIVAEHKRVRASAGLFDVSHMGEFVLTGAGALASLERITTNSVAALGVGGVQYSVMCLEDGGVIDDLLVYRLPDRYMVVVNAANKDKDLAWMLSNKSRDAVLEDVSSGTALVAVQGPDAEAVMNAVTGEDLSSLGYYRSRSVRVAGREMLVSRTGYTGEDGFEIYCAPQEAGAVWDALESAGSVFGIAPIGLGARDTLRLEMAYCLYGQDIDDTRTPVEAGLMWITKLDKGDFIGRESILARRMRGAKEELVAFELLERGIPRQGHRIFSGQEHVGVVTSGTFSPSLEKGIGMGYVRAACAGELSVEVRGRRLAARLVKPPFYRHGSARLKRRKCQQQANL